MKRLVSFVEIPATDFDRAVKFYNKILKIDMKVMNCGEEKMAFFPEGDGAISYSQDFNPSKDGTLVSLNTGKDLDKTISRIEDNGGSITRQKTKIEAEGHGYFALFIDSEGNRVGLYGDN